MPDHFVEGRSASASDLPLSGDPWFHRHQSLPVPHLVAFEFVWNRWPRTHQGHRAAQNVQELRYFVDACLPQESSERSDSRVVRQLVNFGHTTIFLLRTACSCDQALHIFLVNCMIVREIHGPELQEREFLAVLTDSLLAE